LFLLGGLYIDGGTGQFNWWRVMTFGVVHGGIIHIAFNCYAMTVLSGTSEVNLGPKRTLVLITVSQLGAAFATWYWYLQLHGESVFTMGASGWVSGLLGYALVYTWSLGPAGARYRSQLVQWGIYILLFGFFMGANNAAHIGGALAGAVVGYIQNRPARSTKAEDWAWDGAFWACTAIWLCCFAAQALYFAQHIGQFGMTE
ncbi:MAG: rhomboid family intramembrane serine protease, partial [Candidatus Hydrogenedentes bacterium]|nr:rhomboid family intramembrane serine protease [Candidatus Hydrogenedentota bacterium]